MKNFIAARISPYKVINGFKTALACLIGYALFLYTPLPQPQWITITILVVMSAQTSIGSLYIKAKMRFWGTIAGTLASVLIILLCHNNHIALAIALFIAFFGFTYVASTLGDISYMGALGSITVAMIILNPQVSLILAGERFIEIGLGIIISFLVSYFIFPIRSHTLFIDNLVATLHYLKGQFESKDDLIDVDEKILSFFNHQRRLILETGLEWGRSRHDKAIFQKILNCERRIYRGINLIHHSLNTNRGLESFKQEIIDCFTQLIRSLKDTSITTHECIFKDFPNHLGPDAVSNIHVFLFGANLLTHELKNLNQLITQISYLRR